MTPEERRDYNRRYYQANRERLLARQKPRSAARYAAKREEIIERQMARYHAKKEDILPKQREYQRNNLEKRRSWHARSYAANPEPYRLNARLSDSKRRAAKAGGSLSTDEWSGILEEFDNCCAYCQVRDAKLAIEHVVPLSRGGRHEAQNVVPACKSCNSSKGPRTLLEFASIVPVKLRVR